MILSIVKISFRRTQDTEEDESNPFIEMDKDCEKKYSRIKNLCQDQLCTTCSWSDKTQLSCVSVKGGNTSTKPNQVHHYATDKNKTYTQSFRDIADKYGLDLDADWNKELLPHQGRHPNAYHDFVLDEMRNIDNIANGNKDIFLELYESEIKSVIRENPDMLYSDYWKGLKE